MKTPAELAAILRERLIHSRPHYDIKGQPLRTIVVTQEWLEDMADAANALEHQSLIVSEWGTTRGPADPVARRPHCDGTGDVHTPTGEWRGICKCPAGEAIQNASGYADTFPIPDDPQPLREMQPLTDEQIDAALRAAGFRIITPEEVQTARRSARAIERAHGITKGTATVETMPAAYVTDDYGHEGVSHSISASLPVGTPLYTKPVGINKF